MAVGSHANEGADERSLDMAKLESELDAAFVGLFQLVEQNMASIRARAPDGMPTLRYALIAYTAGQERPHKG
jgi:hypothetical protein